MEESTEPGPSWIWVNGKESLMTCWTSVTGNETIETEKVGVGAEKGKEGGPAMLNGGGGLALRTWGGDANPLASRPMMAVATSLWTAPGPFFPLYNLYSCLLLLAVSAQSLLVDSQRSDSVLSFCPRLSSLLQAGTVSAEMVDWIHKSHAHLFSGWLSTHPLGVFTRACCPWMQHG